MTPREALDRIAALCNRASTGIDMDDWVNLAEVRAVLAKVSPEPSGACSCTLTEGDDADSSYVERLIRQDPACPIHRPVLGGVLDRDQARDVLMAFWEHARGPLSLNPDDYLDRLARCVRPAAIDRDALTGELRLGWSGEYDDGYGHRNPATVYLSEGAIRTLADRLVRPVAGVAVVDRSSGREVGGVVLTPEEADDLEAVLQLGLDVYMDSARGPRLRALAARLEAAS